MPNSYSIETRQEITYLVFPELAGGEDPDIKKYFELRQAGRLNEALLVYNKILVLRYPESNSRITLLKLYREQNIAYPSFLSSLLAILGEALSKKILRNIDLLVEPINDVDLSDALLALGALESIFSRLRTDQDKVLNFVEKYLDFAKVLKYKSNKVKKVYELVREYNAMRYSNQDNGYDFLSASRAIEERRRNFLKSQGYTNDSGVETPYDFLKRGAEIEAQNRAESKNKKSIFDPNSIKLSPEEIALVDISAKITRKEDKVLAFCMRYWDRIGDPNFEHLVFLFSIKFASPHFDVFKTIQFGRYKNRPDNEILTIVHDTISKSYSYSISGDIYIQVMWRRYLTRKENEEKIKKDNLEQEKIKRSYSKEFSTNYELTSRIEGSQNLTRKIGDIIGDSTIIISEKSNQERQSINFAKPLFYPIKKMKGLRLLKPAIIWQSPIETLSSMRGSISDTIKRLSGKTYDVYKEIFISHIRDVIRYFLLNNQIRPHGIFENTANEAEECIYAFIITHYDDPYMNWSGSEEAEKINDWGFYVPSLIPIIESCYKRL